MARENHVFLSAEWRDLAMLNYKVDPELLRGHVPRGTILDSFHGMTYLSLVGFRFQHVKLFGALAVPFHTDFDEVNLRFYVRSQQGNEDRRGVVFLAEIVPKRGVVQIARMAYGENYLCLPMKHGIHTDGLRKRVEYQWKVNGAWCKMYAEVFGAPAQPKDGSLEQFITEHYWGYSARRSGHCLEYQVSHPPWDVWASAAAGFAGNGSLIYGPELGAVLQRPPDSAFVADGSPVVVFVGKKIS